MEQYNYAPHELMMINNTTLKPKRHIGKECSNIKNLSSGIELPQASNLHFGTSSKPLAPPTNGEFQAYKNTHNKSVTFENGYPNDLFDVAAFGQHIPVLDSSTLPSVYVAKEISQPTMSDNSDQHTLFDGITKYEDQQEESKDGLKEISFSKEDTIYEYTNSVFGSDDLYENSFGSTSTIWSVDSNKISTDKNTDTRTINEVGNYYYNHDQVDLALIKESQPIAKVKEKEYVYMKTQMPFTIEDIKDSSPTQTTKLIKRGRKGADVKPKMIPSCFKFTDKNSVKLTILESSIQCLSMMIDYHGYSGKLIELPVLNKDMTNKAINSNYSQVVDAKLIALIQPDPLDNQPPPISTLWQRIKYTRDISELYDTITNIVYKKSSIYDTNNPYEPQYYRFEVDDHGELVNESKCGMCAYCEKAKFLPFKNSSYLSHLTLEHGIFSNNYLTPEGIYHGNYLITKNTYEDSDTTPSESPEEADGSVLKKRNQHKPRATEGIACPACFEIVEVGCWKMKSNPLLSYFRHFKKHHKNLTNQRANFQTNPLLTISKRGRKLQVLDS